jgi:hypothetical protein
MQFHHQSIHKAHHGILPGYPVSGPLPHGAQPGPDDGKGALPEEELPGRDEGYE